MNILEIAETIVKYLDAESDSEIDDASGILIDRLQEYEISLDLSCRLVDAYKSMHKSGIGTRKSNIETFVELLRKTGLENEVSSLLKKRLN